MKLLSLLIVAILALPSIPAFAQGKVVNRILVKINEKIITEYDLEERLQPIMDKIKGRDLSAVEQRQLAELRKKAVEDMVSDALIQQEVEKFGVIVNDDTLDAEIARVKKEREMDDATFEDAVAKDGLSMDEFRERLRKILEKQEVINHMVTNKVLVTDSEIEEEYNARKDDYTLDKMVELGIILLPAEVSAVEVRTRILDGEMTFAEAVTNYSVGPGVDSGGSIGEMSYTDLAEDWREAIQGVAQGGVSEPLTIQGKEALLSPLKVSEDRLVPLDEVRNQLFHELMTQKRETVFTDYFEKLRESSVITYMDKSLMPDNGVSQ